MGRRSQWDDLGLHVIDDLGPDYEENLRTTKNTDFEQVNTLLDFSQSFILKVKNDGSQRSYGILLHG